MKLNLLIVDDRPENLLALEKLLQRPDLNIFKAHSGNEALALILEHDCALVLLDVQMPGMDGFETAELMRGIEKTKCIPIIFVTAISKEQHYVFKGYEAGAVDYLFKPLDPDILQSKVNVFLELHRQKITLQEMNAELQMTNNKIREQQKAVIEEERLKVLLQMAGATAYEFNQPLMALLDNIELMEIRNEHPEKRARYITGIKEAGQQIAATVKKIQTIRHAEVKFLDTESDLIHSERTLEILSVEENDSDFQTLRDMLKAQNRINVSRAASIKEALTAVEENRVDMIFSEYLLNDGTGFDVLTHIKNRGLEIPVVIITGHGDEMLASQMFHSGAYDYLPKRKRNTETLARIIHATLEKAQLDLEVKKVHARMAEMATRDELTQLSNRRYFIEALEREFDRATRYEIEMTLVIMDLDHFKNINDTYGHPAGDMVLAKMGAILKEQKRRSDLACRYGGEEFALILPHTDRESACTVCERIRKMVTGHVFEHQSHQFSLTVSIGLASVHDSNSPGDLLSHADQALYQAKETGRNKVCGF